jgi:hypothetical protein
VAARYRQQMSIGDLPVRDHPLAWQEASADHALYIVGKKYMTRHAPDLSQQR